MAEEGGMDPTDGAAGTFGAAEDSSEREATVFDGDEAEPESADAGGAVQPAPTNAESRTQARMNAHHIQKFVNQQGARGGRCSSRAFTAVLSCVMSENDRSSSGLLSCVLRPCSFWRGDAR
jgi:hypothetical protein